MEHTNSTNSRKFLRKVANSYFHILHHHVAGLRVSLLLDLVQPIVGLLERLISQRCCHFFSLFRLRSCSLKNCEAFFLHLSLLDSDFNVFNLLICFPLFLMALSITSRIFMCQKSRNCVCAMLDLIFFS